MRESIFDIETGKAKKTKLQQPQQFTNRDMFQTPNYATKLLIPFIPKNITHIWEPAAGNLKITNALKESGYNVFSSDIRENLEGVTTFDFLNDSDRVDVYHHPFSIITNPPFSLKKQFFEKCIYYNLPFALLIPADYSGWLIDAIDLYKCEKIIPTRRIDYITPSGRNGKTSSSNFHSLWLTRGFNLGKSETFVELTNKLKEDI